MEEFAPRLKPLSPPAEDAPIIHFLSGKQFWYQTVFCAYSLAIRIGPLVRFAITDDGTLTPRIMDLMSRVLPGCSFDTTDMIEKRLDRYLPESQFPALRRRRLAYPHIKKLMDVHAGQVGWKLVLDSDMLFYNRPDFVADWLRDPQLPLHLKDIENAYGYSHRLMSELAGGMIPERVNVGMCGLRSDELDWPRLESWCRILIEREGPHYLQEQAMVAMLLVNAGRVEVPTREAIVRPDISEIMVPSASLHHYVSNSKAGYFRFAWRHIAAVSQRNSQ
jgi:hypothetical protein